MRLPIAFLTICLLAAGIVCGVAPQVVQGTVMEYSADTNTILVSDQAQPDKTYSIALKGAEMGARPAIGDIIRVSCKVKNGELFAIRVMEIAAHEGMSENH